MSDDKRHSVLALVEDEADIRVLIRLTLRKDNRLVLEGEATSAEEAIELARALDPSLVILDHSLGSGMTGLQAAPAIKAAAPGSKILLFTAHDMHSEAEQEPAIDRFLRKDKMPQLLRTVEEMLNLDPVA